MQSVDDAAWRMVALHQSEMASSPGTNLTRARKNAVAGEDAEDARPPVNTRSFD